MSFAGGGVHEFELINRYFAPARTDASVRVPIGDDAAVLVPSSHRDVVAAVDTLVEGVHFPIASAPRDVGCRAVLVNLSDMAAMGAVPRWMTLALTLSDAQSSWLEALADGILGAARRYGVSLVGGDTTCGPGTVVSLQVLGETDPGRALTRAGAQAGDSIYLSGSVGDAAAGLRLIQAGAPSNPLVERFWRPSPRLALGQRLPGLATAAIDVSDGLVADLGKLAAASGVGAALDVEQLPLSPELRAAVDSDQAVTLALSGGDDYELCFTADPRQSDSLQRVASKLAVPLTRIGRDYRRWRGHRPRTGQTFGCRIRGLPALRVRGTDDNSALARQVLRDPVNFLAFGLGTGLSPVAPGTVGSLLGVALAWAMLPASFGVQAAAAVAMVVAGVWLCGESAKRIGVHDHSGIVWDEIAAMYLVLLWFPPTLLMWGLAFALFRLFDVWKPWPISDLDHRLRGGLGIMLDDLAAALYAASCLRLGEWLLTQ